MIGLSAPMRLTPAYRLTFVKDNSLRFTIKGSKKSMAHTDRMRMRVKGGNTSSAIFAEMGVEPPQIAAITARGNALLRVDLILSMKVYYTPSVRHL